MLERSFVMIKPEGVDRAAQILRGLDLLGKGVVTREIEYIPKEVIEEHYSAHRGKKVYLQYYS